MSKIKLFLLLSSIAVIVGFIIYLLLQVSSLKDELLEMERLKTKKEVAYFALQNSYNNLEISCNKQSEEIMKLSEESRKKTEQINKYKSSLESEKYNKKTLDILNRKVESCEAINTKLLDIGKLKYKDL